MVKEKLRWTALWFRDAVLWYRYGAMLRILCWLGEKEEQSGLEGSVRRSPLRSP
jgi:hypothetical protein